MSNKWKFRFAILKVIATACLLMGVAAQSQAQAQAQTASDPLSLVKAHLKAQIDFDADTLKAITHTAYVEISPAGELDEREKMLSFYAPEKKKSAPNVGMSDIVTRDFGDTKLIVVTLNYEMKIQEQIRKFSMQASYLSCKENGEWKICSVQYTGKRQ